VRSVLRIPAWKDNLTLATEDVAAHPRSAKLQAGAGMFLAGQKRYEEAEPHLREAVRIWPDYAQAHYNLSVLLLARGANEEGIEHLLRAHALAPGNPSPVRLLEKFRDDPRMPEELRRRIREEMRAAQAPAAR
jgi:tetratricopeptide (TPR) repeat protein